MATTKILVVEDDPSMREVVALYLRNEGFGVTTAVDGAEAIQMANREHFDLVLLDLMLPKIDGMDVFQSLRDHHSMPIIMLTAKRSEGERVAGLELGADDYVTKPFSTRELVARVKNVLRRSRPTPAANDPLTRPLIFERLRIEPKTHQVLVEEKPVTLTATEFGLLWFMASHRGQVFNRDQLLANVWGHEFDGDPSTVTVHVRRLREKIEADATRPAHILTVWGVGYKFEATP